MTDVDDGQTFTPDWSSAEGLPLHAINQFVGQLGPGSGPRQIPDGIYVTFGVAVPPIRIGDEPLKAHEQDDRGRLKLPVSAVTRIVLTRERAVEITGMLQQLIAQYDAVLDIRGGKP